MPRGRCIELFQAAQRSREMSKMWCRIAATYAERSGTAVGAGCSLLFDPGNAKRNGMAAQSRGEDGIIARQLRQAPGKFEIHSFNETGDAGRRHAIRLRH